MAVAKQEAIRRDIRIASATRYDVVLITHAMPSVCRHCPTLHLAEEFAG